MRLLKNVYTGEPPFYGVVRVVLHFRGAGGFNVTGQGVGTGIARTVAGVGHEGTVLAVCLYGVWTFITFIHPYIEKKLHHNIIGPIIHAMLNDLNFASVINQSIN